MSSELPPSTREPGRRGKQGETRARLIQVAIELVRREGLAALTTSRITRAAGIAQPGFYAHFKNIDDIVASAVSQVIEEMRVKTAQARKRAIAAAEYADNGRAVHFSTTRAAYSEMLEVFLSDPGFAELFLRYRRDPSLLGGFMRDAAQRLREDVIEDLWRNARDAGFRPEHRALVTVWADQSLALYFAAAETLLDGRYEDKKLVTDALARSSHAIMQATVRAAGLTHLLQAPAPAPDQH